MTEDEFWRLINESPRGFDPQVSDGNMARQVGHLRQILSALSTAQLLEFETRVRRGVRAGVPMGPLGRGIHHRKGLF